VNGDQTERTTVAMVSTIVWGLLLIPGFIGALLSGMMFDSPGSVKDPSAYLMAALLVSFPILCIVSIAGSWIVWTTRRNFKRAPAIQIAVACVPLIPGAVFVVVVAVAIVFQLIRRAAGAPD
jgi:hypothetical protein